MSTFEQVVEELERVVVGQKDAVQCVLLAYLCKANVLLLGPPGCGKSLLCKSVATVLGGQTFEILLNKFTTLEEVFGPLKLSALRDHDRYERQCSGRLVDPNNTIIFLDNIFGCSTALLNSLLLVLNEKKYDNIELNQLKFAMAAFPELPERGRIGDILTDDNLGALVYSHAGKRLAIHQS
jgi:MoxR-like ATPase